MTPEVSCNSKVVRDPPSIVRVTDKEGHGVWHGSGSHDEVAA